ncbi:gamma-glutamylcyclotransferase family protein [Anoxynatronum sibiricum]|uniref:Gamma-glutamylcyclotransferase family protein n=1 Tax=Anoxynatronum sibiricum TaxID=210623 RepID=A0ABU9VUI7_9CLOT
MDQSSMEVQVFVYGTLMQRQSNHHYLSNSQRLGEGIVQGYQLYHLGAYPGMVPSAGSEVKGEVYRINETTLAQLDELEDEGGEYRRVKMAVRVAADTLEEVYGYVYQLPVDEKSAVPLRQQPWSL